MAGLGTCAFVSFQDLGWFPFILYSRLNSYSSAGTGPEKYRLGALPVKSVREVAPATVPCVASYRSNRCRNRVG